MDPERVIEGAIALLAPKLPGSVVFKRSECLARIRELQQTYPDSVIIAEFVQLVSRNPENYLAPEPSSTAQAEAGSSSAPKAGRIDRAMPAYYDQIEGTSRSKSSAPESTGPDQHMAIDDSHGAAQIKVSSSSPASPKYDHALMGRDSMFALTPHPVVKASAEQDADEIPRVVRPGEVTKRKSSHLRKFFRRILKWARI